MNRRKLCAAVLVLATVAVAAVVFLGRDEYEVKVQFSYAGQLVRGGEVKVAGRKVGSIQEVALAPDGGAQVTIGIDDERIRPLHVGTRAAIRAVGSAGIANRFIDLSPGSRRAPELQNGAVLPRTQTSEIVELDTILDSFGPSERRNMRALVAGSSELFVGSGAPVFNEMLARLNPGMRRIRRLLGELESDRASLGRAIRSSQVAATAMASRKTDLRNTVTGLAGTFGQLADERAALASSLQRAPGVLRTARGTLDRTARTVRSVRPALRELPPAARPLQTALQANTTMSRRARPVLDQLRGQLPDLRRTLTKLVPLRGPAVAALRSLAPAMRDARPIARGLRFYGADLILGLINGLAGITTGTYNSYGHYLHLELVQTPQAAVSGPLTTLLGAQDLIPGVFGLKTRKLRRCPGGNAPPAPDGSSPWILGPEICSEDDNVSASVNRP